MRVEFFAGGIARPKGSSRAFTAKNGKAHVAPASSKEKGWRSGVSNAAAAAMGHTAPLDGELGVYMAFYMRRPRSHFGSGKNANKLKKSAPGAPTSAPDLSKLVRSVEDALIGIVFVDDARIVAFNVKKSYTNETHPHVGVQVAVWTGAQP